VVDQENNQKKITAFLALLPFILLVSFFVLGSIFIEQGNDVIVISLLVATFGATLIALYTGSSWENVQEKAGQKLAQLFPALLILFSIGGLIGAWILSGTIPYFVNIGLEWIDINTFILTAFLCTGLMSIMTGTSWGSVSTIGIALVGMSSVLQVPTEIVAGAIISGAYFGDKLSPLSDTTNVAALAAGANLYDHIGHMLYTAVPSFLIAGVVYYFVGLSLVDDTNGTFEFPQMAVTLSNEIFGIFKSGFVVIIPPIVILMSIFLKFPALAGIVLSTLVAALIGVFYQDFELSHAVSAIMTGFNTEMLNGREISHLMPLSDDLNVLLNRGGINSMLSAMIIVISAILLMGAMEASGIINYIVDKLLKAANTIFKLIASTMVTGLMMISLSSHGSVSALIVGNLYKNNYKKLGLAPVNLSRSIEDSVTMTDPILPWSVSGVYMATTLGVATIDYAPWALFCLGGPLFSMLYAIMNKKLGFGIKRF